MIPILNSHYSITEQWLVINTKKNTIMHPYIWWEKYPVVTLLIEWEQKKFYLHRLYAEAYIPNPENKPHINHKDKNRQNIYKENLEWVTQAENNKHSWIWRTQTANQKIACVLNGKKNWKNVYQFTKEWHLLWMFNSTREAEAKLGIAHTNISYCCNGTRKSAWWYAWSYLINPY